jgi:hypothetical protein
MFVRACLGKIMHFIYIWRHVFSPVVGDDPNAAAPASVANHPHNGTASVIELCQGDGRVEIKSRRLLGGARLTAVAGLPAVSERRSEDVCALAQMRRQVESGEENMLGAGAAGLHHVC